MNNTVTVIDPMQDGRWDRFVESHAFGWLCHLSGWKRVLETSFPHLHGHYFALVQDGEIRAALPVYEVRSRLIGRRLVSIPFATLSDPLVATSDDMAALLDAAIDLSKRIGIGAIEIRTLLAPGFVLDERLGVSRLFKHHFLGLDNPLEEISRKFHRSCVRQRIARAKAGGIEVTGGETERDLREFYRLYLMSRKRLGLPPQPYHFLQSLWQTFYPEKRIGLLMAKKDGQPVAGLMLFKFRERVSAEFAAYDESFLNFSPLHALFWEAIQDARREEYKIFDFGRTSPDNGSLMDFKNRWGTTVIDLPHYYYPRMLCGRDAAKYDSFSYRFVREICKTAPEPVRVGLGKFLYQHMS